jgi:HEAT repeat protein
MKRFLLLGGLLVGGSLLLQDISVGHGGTYRGPGDTVPPGGGGGGGGGGPSSPGPSGPSTGGPAGPSGPGPATGGPSTGGAAGRGAGPITGGQGSGADLTTWEFWWGFNKDPYLNLKSRVHAGVVSGGGEDFFMGGGTSDKQKNALKPNEETVRTKVVPALKEALEKERSNDIVTGALIALGKIGDIRSEEGTSEFEPAIAKFLKDSNQEIAETAAVALGILANEASVKTLKDLALDTPEGRKLVDSNEVKYRTRAFAAYGLGLIGYTTGKNEVRQEIARTLIDILQKPETSTRDVKVAALVALGLVPIDVDTSESADSQTEHSASRQTQIKYIRRFFQDQNNHQLIRAHAPTALARLLQSRKGALEDSIPADVKEGIAKSFLDAINKNSKEKIEVQQSCVLALGQIGDTDNDKVDADIRKALRAVPNDFSDIQAKNFAMIAVAQVGGRPGKAEGNEEGQKECRNFLLETLTKGKGGLKPWAGIAVGVMERAIADHQGLPNATARQELRDQLKGAGSPDQVGAFSIGLGICEDLESKPLLEEKLDKTSEANARGYVAVGLGLINATTSIKKIQDIVKESKYKPDLLKQAAIGLGLLGDKELVPELVKMLEDAKGLSSQAAIASALGFIGDSRSIDPLVAMLKRKDGLTDSARGFAAVALGIVADKELFPWNSKISTNINYRANTPTLTGDGTGILDIL